MRTIPAGAFRPKVQLRGDGSIVATQVAGWESFEITLQVAKVDGQDRLIALHIEPSEALSSSSVITAARLRRLPLGALVDQALSTRNGDIKQFMRAARRLQSKGRPRGGSDAVRQRVAEVYRAAAEARVSRRQAVANYFHVSPQTADRYIREARAGGALEPWKGATGHDT